MVGLLACRYESGSQPMRDSTNFAVRSEAADDPCSNLRPLKTGHGVTPPIVVRRVEPTFPFGNVRRAAGIVILEAVINRKGQVCSVRVVKSLSPAVDSSTVEALKQWQFKPATKDGAPVDVVFNFAINVHVK
jgi:TonB family protein